MMMMMMMMMIMMMIVMMIMMMTCTFVTRLTMEPSHASVSTLTSHDVTRFVVMAVTTTMLAVHSIVVAGTHWECKEEKWNVTSH